MTETWSAISGSVLFSEYKKESFYPKNFLQKDWEGKIVVLPTLNKKFRLIEASAISKLEHIFPGSGKTAEVYVVNTPVWELFSE